MDAKEVLVSAFKNYITSDSTWTIKCTSQINPNGDTGLCRTFYDDAVGNIDSNWILRLMELINSDDISYARVQSNKLTIKGDLEPIRISEITSLLCELDQ